MQAHKRSLTTTVSLLAALVVLAAAAASCSESAPEKVGTAGGSELIQPVADADHFQRIIRDGGQRLLVFDFYADWCQPCKKLAPVLKKLAGKFADRATFYAVDTDRNQPLAASLQLSGIPYVLFVKNGQSVHSLIGLHPEAAYSRAIERYATDASDDRVADQPDGDIIQGVRVVHRSADAAIDTLYVYRGETVKLIFQDIPFDYAIHIPQYDISAAATVGQDLAVTFKADTVGVFPIFCNGDCPTGDGAQFGQIVVMPFQSSGSAQYRELSAREARAMIQTDNPLILDVRTPAEYYSGHIAGARLIPLQQLDARISEIQNHKEKPVLLYCRSGNRSTVAAEILMRKGFRHLHNLRYGIRQWQQEGYPVVRKTQTAVD